MDFYKLSRVEPTILIIRILVNCLSLQNQLAPPFQRLHVALWVGVTRDGIGVLRLELGKGENCLSGIRRVA